MDFDFPEFRCTHATELGRVELSDLETLDVSRFPLCRSD